MDLVTGAMRSLAPKLLDLLHHEYNLQAGLNNEVRSLAQELEHIDAFLRKVSEVPWDRLDEQVKVWAREAREASYGIEDALDSFLVAHVEDGRQPGDGDPGGGMLSRALKMVADLFVKAKPRRDIAVLVDGIKKQLVEVAERRARYRIDDSLAKPVAPTSSTIDPRLEAMYHEVDQLIGIDESRDQLISMLSCSYQRGNNGLLPDDNNSSSIKKVSVVGVGGLGKTTLVKAVYEKLRNEFDCGAFVPVGRNPDLRVLFKDILLDLDKEKYKDLNMPIMEARHLISEIREFLKDKRYFIVIDDIWEKQSWKVIKLIFVEGNCGSRIITTTRNYEVAEETSSEVYRLRSLSHDHSRKLFYTRIFGGEEKYPDVQSDEVSDKILKKCDGIPLAIITMASLLVGKPREVWSELYSEIGFGQHKGNTYVENTMRILSFSYYDLPSHLRTCLLYLSVFPEDHAIEKDPLIWKWIAEGFVYKKQGNGLFELGEQYFNDLINRSMIQAAESRLDRKAACRVHDMVLDLIRSLARHENSVTILDNNVEVILSQNKQVRRLACQKYDLELITQADRMDMSVVRSYIASLCRINQRVLLLRFKLLRVLAIEGCTFTEGCHFEGLGDLLHVRYLSLRGSSFSELPEEIGNLKFLQTLDVDWSAIGELPASIVRLTQLVCINCGAIEVLPDGDWIGKLTSLEQLAVFFGEGVSENDEYRFNVGRFMQELGSLRELRTLDIRFFFMDDSVQRYLAESLRSLDKIQRITLRLIGCSDYDADIATWETTGSMLPQHLSHLRLDGFEFPRLPPWVKPSRFHHLSSLELTVVTTDEHDLKSLGSLMELRHLELYGMKATVAVSKINAGGDGFFQKLRWLDVQRSMVQLQHEAVDSTFSFCLWNGSDPMPFGSTRRNSCTSVPSDTVMPNLQVLNTYVFVRALIKDGNGDCCSNMGLEYLTSLQKVIVGIQCQGASAAEVEEAEAQLRRYAIGVQAVHPNRPTLEVHRWFEDKMLMSDQDQESEDNSSPTEEEDDDYCNEEDDDDDNGQHKDEEEEGTIAKRRRTHSDEEE